MMQTHATQTVRTPLPAELDSPQAKLVYLYLATAGESTIDEVADTLSMKKLSALSVLRSLSNEELIERDGGRVRILN